MNGELYQKCRIVAAGKKALQTGGSLRYTPGTYENAIAFSFLPERKFFRVQTYTAPDVPAWFTYLKKKGLYDLKLLCPAAEKGRHLLGFSNTEKSRICCFFRDRTQSFFTADWHFDSEKGMWNILYTEHAWHCKLQEIPNFIDNTNSFRAVLSDIQALALQIGCADFAHTFHTAQNLLDGTKAPGPALLPIPQEKLSIFEAARTTDVFGAMGSWNDEPPYLAREKGRYEEYEQLSKALLRNIRRAVLFAINEW